MNHWTTILTREQTEAHLMQHADLSPAHTRANADSWLAMSPDQLEIEKAGAWLCNDGESYMLARSLLAHPAN